MQKTVQAMKLNDQMKTAQKSFSHHWKKTSTLTWTNTLKKTNLQFRGHCVSFYNLWKQQQHTYKERPFLVRMVKLWWRGWGGGIAKVSYATKFLYFYHYSWSQIKNIRNKNNFRSVAGRRLTCQKMLRDSQKPKSKYLEQTALDDINFYTFPHQFNRFQIRLCFVARIASIWGFQ